MKVLKVLNASFPYYLNDDRKNAWLTAGLSLFVIALQLMFHPHINFGKLVVIGSVIFIVMFSTIVLLPKALPGLFDAESWTIGRYALFTLWQCTIIGIVAPLAIHALDIYPERTLWSLITTFQLNMLMYGSITILVVTILLRNVMLRENLRHALQANEQLSQIRNASAAPPVAPYVTIQSDTSETASLRPSDLLYVEANDNYSTLYWKNGNGLEKKMLRVNLKNVETQLGDAFTVRCHRSFIVNIHAITEVSGNANGYKLSIRDTSFTVPVSRSKGAEVIGKIRQMRNLAEAG